MEEMFESSKNVRADVPEKPLSARWRKQFYDNNPDTTGIKEVDKMVVSVVQFIYHEIKAWENGYPIEEPHMLPDGPEREKKWAAEREAYDAKQKLPWIPYLKASLKPVMVVYVALVHILGLIGLAFIPAAKPLTLVWTFLLWPLTAFGITAGTHRLWSHKSYEAGLPFRFFVMILASLANQGSIWHWSRDHRVHHKTSETAADPHNAMRGFFFAHMGWLLVEKDPRVSQFGSTINMTDLANMWEVRFNKHAGAFWNLFWCFLAPGLVASLWGENFLVGLFVPGFLRYLISLHVTWCVNSVAHLYGDHPYEDINPAESPWVSLGAMGEGWHNWHHAFPFDYATSELGPFHQFNPTKLFIDGAAHLGLVWGRRRATDLWEMRKQKLSDGEKVYEKLKGVPFFEHRVVKYGPNRETRQYENQTFLKLEVNAEGSLDTEKITTSVKERTEDEVKKHNKPEDSWIVIHGKVYDTTKFKATHPGGEEIVALYSGDVSDRATVAFDVTGHSGDARKLLASLYVGDLKSASSKRSKRKSSKKSSLKVKDDSPVISAGEWSDFKVADVAKKNDSSIIVTLKPKASKKSINFPVGRHVKIGSTIDGEFVERNYTPIPVGGQSQNELALCVKVYYPNENFPAGGLMSQHLASLSSGSDISLKGPLGLITYKGNGLIDVAGETKHYKSIGFICGGSGITPAFSILANALADSSDKTHFHLLYANNKPSDIMLREEIRQLAADHSDRFQVHYTVSDASSEEDWAFSEGFINEDMVKEHLPSGENGDCFVGVCGPPPMIKFAAIPNLQKHGYSTDDYNLF